MDGAAGRGGCPPSSSSPPKQAQLFSCTYTYARLRHAAGEGVKLIPMEIYLNEFPAWTLKLFPAWRGQGSWGRRERGPPGHPNSPITATSHGGYSPPGSCPCGAEPCHKPRFGPTNCPRAPQGVTRVLPPCWSREKMPVALAAPRQKSGWTSKQVGFCPISCGPWSIR